MHENVGKVFIYCDGFDGTRTCYSKKKKLFYLKKVDTSQNVRI